MASTSSPKVGCFSGFFRRTRRTKHHRDDERNDDGPSTYQVERKLDAEPPYNHFNLCCDFSCGSTTEAWPNDDKPPEYTWNDAKSIYRPEILTTIESTLDEINPQLRALSLQIHDNPELRFEERFAHDLLTSYMARHGFTVTRHYLGLDTAWRAEYQHLGGGRVLGINSEMDALPGMGHACGHNLIAISGVGVAIAVKAALEAHSIPGKVILLGTPAEESGGGKILLLDRGGYDEMDACVM
ncbi:hypothetical protein ONZ45_g18203 [Pleurotus djamor]|nr:hypothetical protein ONZ45_g18203 [Pleurotus djamor]